MATAAIYRRVSTPSQVDGFSLDTQLEQLTELAAKRGLAWEDFCDPGISGEKLEERPALIELLARLDEFDAVLVVDESRLARDELVAAVIRDHLRRASVRLITPSGDTDLTDPLGSLTSGLLALVSQYEQQLRRAKMMTGLEAAARHGYWTGGPAPYGYRPAPTETGHTTLEIHEPEAEFLRTTVSLIVDDGLTPYEACKRIVALGYRTRTGTLWSHRNLRNHLIRRHLLGEIPYRTASSEIPRQYPPLISDERFDQLQAALARRYRGPKPKQRTYPLSGRLQCKCGQAHLVGVYRNDRDTRYYMCPRNASSAVTNDRCPIHPRQRRAQPIEDTIWQAITETLTDPAKLETAAREWISQQGHRAESDSAHRHALEQRLTEIEDERLRTFKDARRLGLTDDETQTLLEQLADDHQQISQELARIPARLADAPSVTDVGQLLDTVVSRLEDANDDTRAEVLELLQIEVLPTHDGYTVEGSMPREPGSRGNIPAGAPRRP